MKNSFFKVIPPNLQEYEMSIREADLENDLFRIAFDEACKQDKPEDAKEELFAWDFFKAGWEAAVRLLNDDSAQPAAPVVDGELPPLTFDAWLDREYPIDHNGRHQGYRDSSPTDLMRAAWQAACVAAARSAPVAPDYELHQDEMMVAATSGKNAWNEIQHYAAQYSQDGPVEIYEVTRRRVAAPSHPDPAGGKDGAA